MKYEIIKGSEKCFEGAPEWCTHVSKSEASGNLSWESADRSIKGNRWQWVGDGRIMQRYDQFVSGRVFTEIIAERRPITEPVWEGEGLPPVGVECEGLFPRHPGNSFEWQDCLVLYVFEHECAVKSKVTSTLHYCDQFRPIRSPEDVERDEAIEAMRDVVLASDQSLTCYESLYNSIAAGKIPGVKLEGK